MKKIICMLLLLQGGFMIAQTETLVTPNGKKVKVNPNSINTADNGLISDNGNVQFGGELIHSTTLTTTSVNTLKIAGLQTGLNTDQLLTIDASNVLRSIPNYSWSIKGNSGTNPVTDFIGTSDNKDVVFKINNFASGLLGVNNTGFGYASMNRTKVTGGGNTAMGRAALQYLTSGNSNAAFGDLALNATVDGGANTAIGVSSMYKNVNGNWNVAVGNNSLYSNVDGYYNVGVGSGSLYNNKSAVYNTGLGMQTLYSLTTGNDNIAIGPNALSITKTSKENIGIGNAALNNITGSYNTANGYQALTYVKTGDFNTIMGYKSGVNYGPNPPNFNFNVTAMNNSVLLGANTRPLADNGINEIVIGSNAIGRGSNTVQIGNSSITEIGGVVNWSIGSDVRLKKDIVTSSYGLNFINKLRPVTYKMKTGTTDLQSGFIAQEVETAANSIGYSFNGIVKPQTENDFYSLRYSEFVVPLVKAVQEQQQMIESQKADIAELKAQVQLLLQAVKK
ncbi:tail fiber domain-containing protein [Flavobacterium johnsoniae]|uniref:tail fiber domain-containing protein n=1 Tax=Flavobacterium johnsoniae TaxID=986 RepID=UPI0025B16A6D|nr:tail fiber domain-containing protein [Flavobacterium johnsoniae]WJS94029.1 tail fiber domain-containing protein [Flavobacterium johnsoniae]